jgi:hypothetical protein
MLCRTGGLSQNLEDIMTGFITATSSKVSAELESNFGAKSCVVYGGTTCANGRWGRLFQPAIESHIGLFQPSGPEPVDQQTAAVTGRRLIVHSFNFDN